MRNQFFYTRKIELPKEEGQTEPKFKEVLDSFNINKVIRSYNLENGNLLVALDDFNEQIDRIPIISNKGKTTDYKNLKRIASSNIILENPDDISAFKDLTNINKYNSNMESPYPPIM